MNTDNKSFFERLNAWLRNSVTIKLLSTGILVLLLLIPSAMIESLIRERQATCQTAFDEVSAKWSGPQTIAGPVLNIPYKTYYKKENEYIETIEYAHFLPENLKISGTLHPEKRYRGIYEVIVYRAELLLSGQFTQPLLSGWNIDSRHILWDKSFINIGIADVRGINKNIELHWNSGHYLLDPGIENQDVVASGVSVKVPLMNDSANASYDFSFRLDLNGSREVFFAPLGKETDVLLSSPWNAPSFEGAFLPDIRTVADTGFSSRWKVLHLNRNFPQQWLGTAYKINDYLFGVNLIVPVDHYLKSERSAKYAVLIIALTFLVFFFVEILNRQRIHPFQYLLVGLAVCIFYTLLISISEHLNFNSAYIISGVATIAAVTTYSKTVFRLAKPTLLFGLILILIYGFIYTIIQLEDYALLMGSIGLFIVMLIVMYLSRNIDWYSGSADDMDK